MKRYIITAGIVAVAVLAQSLLWTVVQIGPLLFMYPAVVMSAVYGSAPFALGLTALSVQYFFFEPRFSFAISLEAALVQLLYLVSGLFIWYLGNLRERALLRAYQDRERLRNLASELHITLQSIGDAVISTDVHGHILFINRAAEQATGWTRGEATHHPLGDVFNIEHEVTRTPSACPVDAVLRTGTVVGLANHTVLLRRDGTEIAIEDSAAPIRSSSGEMLGVVLVFRDASESRAAQKLLQESEKRFRAMFNLAGVGMFQSDPYTGRFLRVNSKLCAVTGYTEETLLGKTLRDVLHPDSQQVGLANMQDLLAGRISGFEIEACFNTADGRIITALCNTVLTSTTPMALVTAVQDITAAKANEARLVEAIRARDQFLSIASHELKTPLTSSKLQSQMRMRYLRRRDVNAFTNERLAKMLQDDAHQIDRLARLVDDMLDISRINTGKLTIQSEPFDLRKLVEEVLGRFELQLETAGCAVSLHAERPVVGVWDRFRTEQVVVNLLTNAIRYGAKRPIEIVVQHDGAWAQLVVRDHGIGISPADQERIFECFERAVPAKEVSGLGLGLYIANRIAHIHGGSIEVHSDLGAGATFTLHLPLHGHPTVDVGPVSTLPLGLRRKSLQSTS